MDLDQLADRPFLRYAPDLYIGRQIEAALRRGRMRPAHRYDFTTNRALFAMIEQSRGWAITTALAVLGTPIPGALRVHRLPLPGFSRRLSLHSRREALGTLPALMAQTLRRSISDRMLARLGDVPGLEAGDLIVPAYDAKKLKQ